MRYAMIMAGGSGTRLWPMSRKTLPKQLIPFIQGQSLLQVAVDRLDNLVPSDHQYICAGQTHQQAILGALPDFSNGRYLAEPAARDTLNAVGFAAAVINQRDPDAVMAVLTADHIIEPRDHFQKIMKQGFDFVEAYDNSLATFGIWPTHAATGYGYLELGETCGNGPARIVSQFKEKPDCATAQHYLDAGPERYLWNSGMFIWRASTLLACIKRYAPENYQGLMKIADAWDTDQAQSVLQEIYPTLPRISVDYAIMEPAANDSQVTVSAIPMPLTWLDVGSWPAFAQTCDCDEAGNAVAASKNIMLDSHNNLLVSNDADHLVTTIGCSDLIIIHTQNATLVCAADQAEKIKQLQEKVEQQFGSHWT